jgi:hypothetical protein
MKTKFMVLALSLFLTFICFGEASARGSRFGGNSGLRGRSTCSSVPVKGYVRKDGTFVMPHSRTSPNATIKDNYGTFPNVNPYTGKIGTINPYSAQ